MTLPTTAPAGVWRCSSATRPIPFAFGEIRYTDVGGALALQAMFLEDKVAEAELIRAGAIGEELGNILAVGNELLPTGEHDHKIPVGSVPTGLVPAFPFGMCSTAALEPGLSSSTIIWSLESSLGHSPVCR